MSTHKAVDSIKLFGGPAQVCNVIGAINRFETHSWRTPEFEVNNLNVAQRHAVVSGGEITALESKAVKTFPLAANIHTAIVRLVGSEYRTRIVQVALDRGARAKTSHALVKQCFEILIAVRV